MHHTFITSIDFNSSATLESEWLRLLDEEIAKLLYRIVPDIHTRCTVITAARRD